MQEKAGKERNVIGGLFILETCTTVVMLQYYGCTRVKLLYHTCDWRPEMTLVDGNYFLNRAGHAKRVTTCDENACRSEIGAGAMSA